MTAFICHYQKRSPVWLRTAIELVTEPDCHLPDWIPSPGMATGDTCPDPTDWEKWVPLRRKKNYSHLLVILRKEHPGGMTNAADRAAECSHHRSLWSKVTFLRFSPQAGTPNPPVIYGLFSSKQLYPLLQCTCQYVTTGLLICSSHLEGRDQFAAEQGA